MGTGFDSTFGTGSGMVSPSTLSTSLGRAGTIGRPSRRRTSASSSSTKISPGTTSAPLSALSIKEIEKIQEEDEDEVDSTGKRPSKRQRCDSEAVSVAGSTGTSTSSFEGFGSLNGSNFLSNSMEGLMSMSMPTSALGEGDFANVKIEEEDGVASASGAIEGDDLTQKGKKRKPFKPWNVSPASSHLPSGSACINPVTGEVELPPLDNLTKEEIRKVKNRASAQRSRTRKVEWASGLREENDKLRDEIDVLRAGLEGAAMGMNGMGSGADDGEKVMLKALIKTLRSELHSEKSTRERVNAEMMSLQAQLASAKASIVAANKAVTAASVNGNGNIVALPSPDRSSDADSDVIRDFGQDQEDAERGELVAVRAGKKDVKAIKKDGKGVLMMVVLFSFALFSMPPNLRSSAFSAGFPSRLMNTGASGQPSGLSGHVLAFDDLITLNRTEETDMTCADPADLDADAEGGGDAKCPAPMGFTLNGPESKFQRMDVPLGQGLPRTMVNSAMKGRKSLSLTLLKPYDKGTSEIDQKGEVEDVLEKWLGLSLFEEERNGSGSSAGRTGSGGGEETPMSMPGAWVVVKALPSVAEEAEDTSLEASLSPPGATTPLKPLQTWDETMFEPTGLESHLLTISAGSTSPAGDVANDKTTKTPFQPDLRKGFEATLAPEMTMEDLLETPHQQPKLESSRTSRRASDASTTSTISVRPSHRYRQAPASAALMALTSTQTAASQARQIFHLQEAEQYVKLELEVDLEMELTCKAVRRRRTTVGSASELEGFKGGLEGARGFSLVGREELGRMLDGEGAGGSDKGKRHAFLSLEV